MKQTDAAANLVSAVEESKEQTGGAIVRFDLIGPLGLVRTVGVDFEMMVAGHKTLGLERICCLL